MNRDFDVVVLGGGSAGYATALRASQLGLSVALIERDRLGGTCLHRGCVPTKALLHVGELADATRDGAAHGLRSMLGGIDMNGVNAFKERVVGRLHQGLQGLVKASAVTYVEGEGRLVEPRMVEVAGVRYTGKSVVLATGSYPRTIPGLEVSARVVTSDEALALNEVPGRVVIVGGSVIGVEFASVWRSFGAEVTIVEALPTLVPLEDPSIGKQLERAFRKRGIRFKVGTALTSVKETSTAVTVNLDNDQRINADIVLVAVGRGPASRGLGLEEQGIEMRSGWVVTDERLHTNLPDVYAAGDLVAGLQLAHRGFAHGIFVAEEIAGLAPRPVIDATIPRVTYCDPEIASVGLTEPEARESVGDIDVYEYNLAGNGKSLILGTGGFVKVVREKGGPIVGVHMLGSRMSEQAGEAALIVNWEAMPEDVVAFIHAHPTQNESLGEAALALAGKPLHAHA